MTSIIKLHSISGAKDESPPCYLLQVDDVKILLDCGWDEKFDFEVIKELKRHVHSIDAVLISYPDVYHLGALPYLVGKLDLSCPIYATIPVYKMGQMFMYDMYQSQHNMHDFELFNLDDVDAAFERIVQLKYNQSVSMKGKGFGISITPLPAGHMIGGTIWKIMKVGEEDIIYANDFNHKKERHLNGCELEKLHRPSLLIIDSFNSLYQQARRRTRDEKLMTNILQTLRNHGNVLVCVDTAGRVLELAHMMDQLWRNRESGLIAYSLAFLTNVSYNVVEFAKSQIEWMSDKLMKTFEGARNNPFQFKHLQLCHSMAEVAKVPSPKVVLASMPDLEAGFSRELFLQWATNANNSIILTSRTSPGTLARDLVDNGGNRVIDLEVRRRVRLEGAELEEYERLKREQEQVKRNEMEINESSDEELEMYVISKGKHDIVVKHETKPHASGFFKVTKKQHAMFPFHEEKIKCDEYGEIINPDDYKIIETPMDMSDAIVVDPVEDDEIVAEIPEVPTKCVRSQRSVNVQAQIQFIDFEGRSDGESLLKIVTQLRPRTVIVVRGNEENTQAMAERCKKIGARVFTPARGETVDATTETHIYQVTLTDALVSQIKFQKGKDGTELAWIDAQIGMKNLSVDLKLTNRLNDEPAANEDDENKLTLEPIAVDDGTMHQPIFINDLKMTDFKQILLKNNISSEFKSGVLWCADGTVALRKGSSGKILMDGCPSDEYYKIRQLLYQQFAIL